MEVQGYATNSFQNKFHIKKKCLSNTIFNGIHTKIDLHCHELITLKDLINEKLARFLCTLVTMSNLYKHDYKDGTLYVLNFVHKKYSCKIIMDFKDEYLNITKLSEAYRYACFSKIIIKEKTSWLQYLFHSELEYYIFINNNIPLLISDVLQYKSPNITFYTHMDGKYTINESNNNHKCVTFNLNFNT